MNILAIDPGYGKVGYAILKKTGSTNKDYTFITSGLIKTSAKEHGEQRLLMIYNKLLKIITQRSPDILVIEKLFFFKNKKTVLQVAQAVGVIELLAAQKNIKVERLTPLQIKQSITGYGTADKKSVQKMLRLELGEVLQFQDDDESDAIACGIAYCFLY